MHGKKEVLSFRKITPMGTEILPKRYFVLKIVSLITERSHPNLHNL